MLLYFKIVYASGSQKLIKGNSSGCEIYLKSPAGNKRTIVAKPYPIFEENDFEQITEDEFKNEIEGIDFKFEETKSLTYEE
jgi:hypothetical protein